jgi:hypothetical protein
MGLSRRAYAARIGKSEAYIRKMIAQGRIKPEEDGTLDPDKADAALGAENGKAPKAEGRLRPVPEVAVDSVRETLRENGLPPTAGGMTYLQARTANEVLKAQERRLRLQRLKDELVDRNRVIAHVFSLARAERDAWIGWPARVAALMAAELGVDAHQLEQLMLAHVRAHLETLAEPRIDLR